MRALFPCPILNTLTIFAGAEELEPPKDQPFDPLDPPNPPKPLPPKKNADAADRHSAHRAIITNTCLVYAEEKINNKFKLQQMKIQKNTQTQIKYSFSSR